MTSQTMRSGEDEADGFLGAEEFGHDEDVDHGKAGKSRFGEAETECGEEGQRVVSGGDVGEEVQGDAWWDRAINAGA